MRERPDCGGTNLHNQGFSCGHEKRPVAYEQLKKENMQLRNLLEAVREENQRLRVKLETAS
jgi:hypothetical protein